MISHKLNEIAAIADSITIIRDGRSVETLDVAGRRAVDEDRIIRGMVGRDARLPLPRAHLQHRRGVLRGQGLDGPAPAGHRPAGLQGVELLRPSRRDRRLRRPDGRRPYRAGPIPVRPLLRHLGRQGQIFLDGRADRAQERAGRRSSTGLAYVTEDRKVLGLNLLDNIRTTVVSADLTKISLRGVVDRTASSAAAEEYRQALRIKTPTVNEGVIKLSGGNQQKVVAGQVDVHRAGAADPRRADPRHRRRCQVRDLRRSSNALADEGKGVMVISSELPELLGTLRPDLHGLRGPHHRLPGRGRGRPGVPDAAA